MNLTTYVYVFAVEQFLVEDLGLHGAALCESGHGARLFDIDWARSSVEQCESAGVAVFCKQLGGNPVEVAEPADYVPKTLRRLRLADRKGGDTAEWPEDLRVRQFPEVRHG
jgi:hypothetical protein